MGGWLNQISASLGGCLNFKVPSEGTTCFNGIALRHMSIAYTIYSKVLHKISSKNQTLSTFLKA